MRASERSGLILKLISAAILSEFIKVIQRDFFSQINIMQPKIENKLKQKYTEEISSAWF